MLVSSQTLTSGYQRGKGFCDDGDGLLATHIAILGSDLESFEYSQLRFKSEVDAKLVTYYINLSSLKQKSCPWPFRYGGPN